MQKRPPNSLEDFSLLEDTTMYRRIQNWADARQRDLEKMPEKAVVWKPRLEALVCGIREIEADHYQYRSLQNRDIPGALGYFGTCWIQFLVKITGEKHWRTISPVDFKAILLAFRQIMCTFYRDTLHKNEYVKIFM